MSDSEDWVVNNSDDELKPANDSNVWEPSPQEIMTLYEAIESKTVLNLEWQCPGRRSPSVNSIKSDMIEKGAASDEDNKVTNEPNEFDFDEEFFNGDHPSPKISPRKRVTQATSAQKRVARLDKVMFDIQRHRKLDELELQKSSPHSKTNSPKTLSNDKT